MGYNSMMNIESEGSYRGVTMTYFKVVASQAWTEWRKPPRWGWANMTGPRMEFGSDTFRILLRRVTAR